MECIETKSCLLEANLTDFESFRGVPGRHFYRFFVLLLKTSPKSIQNQCPKMIKPYYTQLQMIFGALDVTIVTQNAMLSLNRFYTLFVSLLL